MYRRLCHLLYTRFAWAYDIVAWIVSAGAWSTWRQTAVPHVRGDCVVDLACGTGRLLEHLTSENRVVVGVDRSPQMILQAARRTRADGTHTPNLVMAEAQALPFATGSVSTVVATFPAGYILDPATHRECARVLKSGAGRLVIAGLWVEPLRRILRIVPLFYGRPDSGAVAGLRRALEHAGFLPTIRNCDSASARIGLIVADRAE